MLEKRRQRNKAEEKWKGGNFAVCSWRSLHERSGNENWEDRAWGSSADLVMVLPMKIFSMYSYAFIAAQCRLSLCSTGEDEKWQSIITKHLAFHSRFCSLSWARTFSLVNQRTFRQFWCDIWMQHGLMQMGCQ